MFQSLSLFVFDDTDPEQASFLGCAKVSLIYLAHDKPIKASFELFSVSTPVLLLLGSDYTVL